MPKIEKKDVYLQRCICPKGCPFGRTHTLEFWNICYFNRVDFPCVKLSLLLYSNAHSVFTFINSFDGIGPGKSLFGWNSDFCPPYVLRRFWTIHRIVYVDLDLIIDHCVRSSKTSLWEWNSRNRKKMIFALEKWYYQFKSSCFSRVLVLCLRIITFAATWR